MREVELLAPAGDLEKLKIAVDYGADAVYLGGEAFGLRKRSKNFGEAELVEGIKYAHDQGVKVYVTMNIVPHNEDLTGVAEYAKFLEELGVDGVIVSDPGMFMIIKNAAPNIEIHISTQASVTNYETINFWYEQGAKRVVLARELSIEEISEIRKNIPEDMEIEVFVHGAMCISYSGRCLLSNYMTGRDANKGDCAHPCRYKYHLVEETRPGEYFPVYEDEEGSFIMNSKDLCMIEYIDKLIEAGVDSLKIEGRMKGIYYVATVLRSYRNTIDLYYKDPENYSFDPYFLEEIKKVSHRDFTTGFFLGEPTEEAQVYTTSSYIKGYNFVGLVLDYDKESKLATVEQRNRIFLGDELELIGPKDRHYTFTVEEMYNEDKEPIEVAPHAQQIIKIKMDREVTANNLLRKEIDG